ncbi:MAG: Na+/H+ antiporter subunit C [Pseudomonadota bacterium]
METVLCVVVGLFFAASIYMMLSARLVRIMLGIAIFGNAVNLFIFTAGRLTTASPPVIDSAENVAEIAANPLPQALILTAIVISFSIFAFLLVLTFRAYQALDTDDVGDMRVAEPVGETRPPLGY